MRTRIARAVLALCAVTGPSVAEAGEPAPGIEVTFLTPETTVWAGRTQVIPFHVPGAAGAEGSFAARVADPARLEILRPPQVLAGETTGYLRVRGVEVGETRLSIGSAVLRVHVKRPPSAARLNRTTARITGLAPGAMVWGELAVGVEVWPGAEGLADDATVRLRLSDGTELEPRTVLSEERGPALRASCVVDTASLPVGPVELTAVVGSPGAESAFSEPVRVNVHHPKDGEVQAFECEDYADAERPETFGEDTPMLGHSPDASGGGFVKNDRPDPAWLLPFEVREPGRYQMIVTARGDFAAGAFPSVGLCVDGTNAETTGRLVDRLWHRLALGVPVALESGRRTLSVRFLNDLTLTSTTDRNLYLDRVELLRVEEADGAAGIRSDYGMALDASLSMGGGERSMGGMARATGTTGGLWIALDKSLDGLPVNGRLEIQGYCRWRGMEDTAAPLVELLVNGETVSAQQAVRPLFALDRAAFALGENAVQLAATLADGRRAVTPVQTLHVSGRAGAVEPRALHRFSVHDERWRAAFAPALDDAGQDAGQSVARPSGPLRAELALPADLAGEFDVILDAQGPNAPESAAVRVALTSETGTDPIAEVRVANWWSYRDAGRVSLAPGPGKSLVVELEPSGGDARAGLALRAVMLRTRRPEPDRTPPRASIVYPASGHVAFGVDAVVVDAWDDDDRLQSGDVWIDGKPQGTFAHVPEGAGYLVLPLLLRDVAPGEHALSVRVVDRTGNVGESGEIPFTVSASAPDSSPYARAVRLLNRFALGPDPRELAALLTLGEREWLASRLAAAGAGDDAAMGAAVARRLDYYHHTIKRSVTAHLLRTPNPVRARLVFWVENHFSTWMGKTQPPSEWYEHLGFAALGAAPFGELLFNSATSPTMLYYLDQVQSYAGRLNENYAREIMELHTVGVDGGYTQAEVTALAELLTGLTLSEEASPIGEGGYLTRQLRYDPDLGAGGVREILGLRFEETAPEDRFDRFRLALELLAAHPSTARFVARSLAEHYVAAPAPEALVDDLSRVFLASGGDLRALLPALAEHPAFWEEGAPRLASPFDYGVRLARATGLRVLDWSLSGFLDRSGMGLFDRITPDGYPEEDAAWADTNAMLQRWRFVREVPWAVRRIVPDELRQAPAGDPDPWRQRVIDVAAVRLTGWTLGEESNRAAREYFADLDGAAWQQVDDVAALVACLPEANTK